MPPGEELDWHRPDARLGRLRHLQVAASTAAVLAIGAVIAALGAGVAGAATAGAGLAAGVLADGLAQRRVRAWGFAERSEDLLVRRGVLVRRMSVIPYGRMQFVDVTAGPLERLFGLATVRMHTAAASDARLPGLATTEAARLRDQLAALGEHRATGL